MAEKKITINNGRRIEIDYTNDYKKFLMGKILELFETAELNYNVNMDIGGKPEDIKYTYYNFEFRVKQ